MACRLPCVVAGCTSAHLTPWQSFSVGARNRSYSRCKRAVSIGWHVPRNMLAKSRSLRRSNSLTFSTRGVRIAAPSIRCQKPNSWLEISESGTRWVTTQVTQTKGASLSFIFRLGRELKVLLDTEPGVSLLGAGFRPKPKSVVRGKSEYEKHLDAHGTTVSRDRLPLLALAWAAG
jgi:hypothetical protein